MQRIPEWLAPYKNEWRTVGKLSQIIAVNGPRSFATWFEEIKHRCRHVAEPRGRGVQRSYLVKNVWAMSVAHGVTLIDAQVMKADELSRLSTLVQAKRQEYEQLLRGADKASRAIREAEFETSKLNQFLFQKSGQLNIPKALLLASPPTPQSGVYFLIKGDEVVYVGRSKNVLARMAGHVDKSFDRVLMIPVAEEFCSAIEAHMIGWFLPPLNTHLMPPRIAY